MAATKHIQQQGEKDRKNSQNTTQKLATKLETTLIMNILCV